MDNELVSIIVPIYNVGPYLRKGMESLKNQTYQNIEILLINDGSTDNSKAICKEYTQKDSRFIYIEKENGGVSTARNKGLEEASGAYVIFMDPDDYIDKDTIKVLLSKIKEEKCDIIKYEYIKESKILKKRYKFSIDKNVKISKEDYAKKIYPYIFKTFDLSSCCNTIFKKEIFQNLRFDTHLKYGEDFKFVVQAVLNSQSIFILPKCLYHYIYRSSGSINSQDIQKQRKKLIDNINCCIELQENIGAIETLEDAKNRIQSVIMNFCAIIAEKNEYEAYVKNMQEFMKEEEVKKVEKKYFTVFKEELWDNMLNIKYYQELKKYNRKIKLKKQVLKIVGG